MIRYRLKELECAGGRIIALARTVRPIETVAKQALERLALTAGSDRAAYWVADHRERWGLRMLATWSALHPQAQAFECDTPPWTLTPSQGNAAHVWHSKKPLWSVRPLLDMGLPRLYGGVWFAVKSDTVVFGVIELLGRAFELAAPENLITLERLGFRLGLGLETRAVPARASTEGDRP